MYVVTAGYPKKILNLYVQTESYEYLYTYISEARLAGWL